MEPNKLENQIKEKLNSRTMQPSTQAWDRLDAMLAVAHPSPDNYRGEQPNQKPKRNFSWLFIAASFIGFLLIATVFLSQSEELIDVKRKEVVLDNLKEEIKNQNLKIKNNTNPINSEETIKMQNSKSVVAIKNPNQWIIKPKIEIKNQKTEIVSINSRLNENAISENVPPKSDLSVNELKNQTALLNNNNQLIAENNSLNEEKLLNENPKIKVDASKLLSQVDKELNITFREKAIQTVTKNYKTVKVALANRNQE